MRLSHMFKMSSYHFRGAITEFIFVIIMSHILFRILLKKKMSKAFCDNVANLVWRYCRNTRQMRFYKLQACHEYFAVWIILDSFVNCR